MEIQTMNFIAIVKLLIQLLPVVIEAIQAIEAAFPAGGQGQVKMELIKSTVQGAYSAATDATAAFDTLWTPLQSMISSVVGVFNSTGLFKKS